jgi:plastocyanin
MTGRYRWLVTVALCVLAAGVRGEAATVRESIIKGTITIAGKPTADVVVSIEGVAPEAAKARAAALKSKKALMDQREMKFIPYVLPVLAGTTVDFPNNDKIWHNAYSKSAAREFDLGLYPPGKSRSVTFDKAGEVRIFCNVHPTMEAFILIKDHPYFSAADKRGQFRVDGVPLGKFRIQVWHPQLGTTEAGVELVREGEVVDINFDLKKK